MSLFTDASRVTAIGAELPLLPGINERLRSP